MNKREAKQQAFMRLYWIIQQAKDAGAFVTYGATEDSKKIDNAVDEIQEEVARRAGDAMAKNNEAIMIAATTKAHIFR